MVRILAISSALALVAAVSGYVVPRTNPPAGWVTDIMEAYDQYHTRYMALDCQDKHNTAFFDLCCHPLKANETLATARDPSCDPANVSASASNSASAAAPAATNAASSDDDDCEDDDDSSDDDDECEDDDGGDAGSVVPPTTTTQVASVPIVKSETSTAVPETTTAAPAKTSADPKTSIEPETTTKPAATTKPETTVKPSSTHKESSSSPAPSSTSTSSSSSGGDWIEGGFATFFDQGGAAGSCGNVNPDSALIVAVQEDRMKSSLCGKKVFIVNTDNGKSVTATVADTCPGCKNANSLDLSHGAFDAIGAEATGVLNIKWEFLD